MTKPRWTLHKTSFRKPGWQLDPRHAEGLTECGPSVDSKEEMMPTGNLPENWQKKTPQIQI